MLNDPFSVDCTIVNSVRSGEDDNSRARSACDDSAAKACTVAPAIGFPSSVMIVPVIAASAAEAAKKRSAQAVRMSGICTKRATCQLTV